MEAAYDLIAASAGTSLKHLLLIAGDHTHYHHVPSCGRITLYVSRNFSLWRLIKSLKSERCGINTIYIARLFPAIIKCLSEGKFPSVTKLRFSWEMQISSLDSMIRSRHSSVTTIARSVWEVGELNKVKKALADLNCQVTQFSSDLNERMGADIAHIIRERNVKCLLLTVSSARGRVGTRSVLQKLAQVLVRHLGTFLI
jgi:hypothetical protein